MASGPDAVYVFDPLLIADRGAIPLRSGKPTRRGEQRPHSRAWTGLRRHPDGRPDRSARHGRRRRHVLASTGSVLHQPLLRTNRAGAKQLAEIVGGEVEIFDLPYWRGAGEVLHLLSVISPVADDLAVVYPPLLPAGLYELLSELAIRTIPVGDDEFETLASNVLAVSPGVVILADGNPHTSAALSQAGCEVHTLDLSEIGLNGSGGPTCLTRPIWRQTAP